MILVQNEKVGVNDDDDDEKRIWCDDRAIKKNPSDIRPSQAHASAAILS